MKCYNISMNRDELINALTKEGYFYKWSKYTTHQLYRIYQKSIENVNIIQTPIYHWFLQLPDNSFIEFSNYKNYLTACKKYNKTGYKIKVGEKTCY